MASFGLPAVLKQLPSAVVGPGLQVGILRVGLADHVHDQLDCVVRFAGAGQAGGLAQQGGQLLPLDFLAVALHAFRLFVLLDGLGVLLLSFERTAGEDRGLDLVVGPGSVAELGVVAFGFVEFLVGGQQVTEHLAGGEVVVVGRVLLGKGEQQPAGILHAVAAAPHGQAGHQHGLVKVEVLLDFRAPDFRRIDLIDQGQGLGQLAGFHRRAGILQVLGIFVEFDVVDLVHGKRLGNLPLLDLDDRGAHFRHVAVDHVGRALQQLDAIQGRTLGTDRNGQQTRCQTTPPNHNAAP